MSNDAFRKKSRWRKPYSVVLGILVVVLVAGVFGWVWLSEPLQQAEPREEGKAPNFARALTMRQDPNEVMRVLRIGESQTSLKAMPGDLQKYGTKFGVWGQVYVAATNKAGDNLLGSDASEVSDKTLNAASFEIEKYPDKTANGYPLVSDGEELHMLSVQGCYPFTSKPAEGAPLMSEFSTYGEMGNVQSGSVGGHSYPILYDEQKSALEAATFTADESAKAICSFGENEAMSLLEDLGFSRETLKESDSFYFFRGFDAAVKEMLPDLEEDAAVYAEYLTQSPTLYIPIFDNSTISEGYCWKGEAEIDGKTVHIRLSACNQTCLLLYCETAVMPGQYVLGQAGQNILVCCSLDEEGFSELYGGGRFDFSSEAGFQTSREPYRFVTEALPSAQERGSEGDGNISQTQPDDALEDIEGVWVNDRMSYEFEITPGNNAIGTVTLRQGEGSLSGDWQMGVPVEIDGSVYPFSLTMGGTLRYASLSEGGQTLTISLGGGETQTFSRQEDSDAGATVKEFYLPKSGYLIVLDISEDSWVVETRAIDGGAYADSPAGVRVVEGTVHDSTALVAKDGATYSLEDAGDSVVLSCVRGATEVTPVVEGTYLKDEDVALAAA